ncbi:MAG TPA: membrane dipeptidase, partial [Chitinophagaceae bacterium]|nr:membrane dipeptidase [Chitinophagaceae bacterium]
LNKLYVELQVKKTDWDAAWGTGRRGPWGETEDGYVRVDRVTPAINGEDLYRYYFDLGSYLNNQYLQKTIRIKIVDEKTTGIGHINADDFVFKESLSEYIPVQKSGYSLLADADKPVWGFADTHAHWMNHVGLNGLMHGTPGGALETSDVRRDIPPCDGFNHGLPSPTPGLLTAQVETNAMARFPERLTNPGNALCGISAIPSVLLNITPGVLHASAFACAASGNIDPLLGTAFITLMINPVFQGCGYQFIKDVFAKHYNNNVPDMQTGNFIDFPRWNTFFHQLMHITWVKRSFDGGQRLMVVPVGVAKSWEFNTTGDGVMKAPKEHIEKAIQALKTLVSQNNSWLEIARSPKQAREIILNNKMAIIIALEQAEIGNYFSSENEEVNWLDSLGVRHVFPVHNINNKIGGTAVFNTALNSYNDLVNRTHPDGPITAFEVKEGRSNDERNVAVKLGRGFMRQNMRFIPLIGYGNIPFFYMNNVPESYNYTNFIAHKNKNGLTDYGRNYIRSLLKKGMIIDIDHMSDLSQDETMQMLRMYNYPMISGHTNFRDLRRDAYETAGGDKEARLKTEFTIFSSRADEINNAGGMFGLMTQQNNIRDAGRGCPTGNTTAGGTSSFIQAYWYAALKTNFEKGIAFGSDFNGFAPQVAPRFGTEAIYYLEGDDSLNKKTDDRLSYATIRRRNAFRQGYGVRYDSPINTWHYHRFPPTSFLTMEERDIWEAIAMAKSGADLSAAWQPGGVFAAAERTIQQQNKIRNIANGFRWAQLRQPNGDYGNFLQCHDIAEGLRGECPNERWAAYMCVHGENSIPQHLKYDRTMELYQVMKRIYTLWMSFEQGPNEPLRRSYAYPGGRDFDYNLDGLAHYGMFPDMIQDMKNLGLRDYQLRPLFLGSEQYIQMWEKAEAAKNNLRD